MEGDNSGALAAQPTEDKCPVIQTTQAVLTLEMLDFNGDDDDDEEDSVSEAEETPPVSCRRRSDVSQNTGWHWPSQDQNNNPRPISQRPRLSTPPPEPDYDLDTIYRLSDFQKCGTCQIPMNGIEIDLSHPVRPICTVCQPTPVIQEAQEIVEEHELEHDTLDLPPHAEVVSECYCVII